LQPFWALALAGTSFSVQNLYQMPQWDITYRLGAGWLCAIWQSANILCQWLCLSKESVGGKEKLHGFLTTDGPSAAKLQLHIHKP
jgi:hypothetical protein